MSPKLRVIPNKVYVDILYNTKLNDIRNQN